MKRLFTAARLRPLAEYGRDTERLPKSLHKGTQTWHKEPLRLEQLELTAQRGRLRLKNKPLLIAELEWTGRQRALMYKTLDNHLSLRSLSGVFRDFHAQFDPKPH